MQQLIHWSCNAMTNPDLSIIIVSQNASRATAQALTSIMAETRNTQYEVIVVDLASRDGPERYIGAHPIRPHVIRFESAMTVARATNAAARQARGKYLLLLSPEAVVIGGGLDKIVAFAETHPKARIWGGRLLLRNGQLNPTSCWRRMSMWTVFCRASGLTGLFPQTGLFNSEAYGGWERDTIREVDIVTDSFFLIDRELWNGLRGFDPAFLDCGQEADLCLRARGFGARPLFTPMARVIYHGRIGVPRCTDRTVAMLNAKAALIRRHWPIVLRPLGLSMLAVWPLTRAIATSVTAAATRADGAVFLSLHWWRVWRRRAEWKNQPATVEDAETSAAKLSHYAS